MDEMERPRCK